MNNDGASIKYYDLKDKVDSWINIRLASNNAIWISIINGWDLEFQLDYKFLNDLIDLLEKLQISIKDGSLENNEFEEKIQSGFDYIYNSEKVDKLHVSYTLCIESDGSNCYFDVEISDELDFETNSNATLFDLETLDLLIATLKEIFLIIRPD